MRMLSSKSLTIVLLLCFLPQSSNSFKVPGILKRGSKINLPEREKRKDDEPRLCRSLPSFVLAHARRPPTSVLQYASETDVGPELLHRMARFVVMRMGCNLLQKLQDKQENGDAPALEISSTMHKKEGDRVVALKDEFSSGADLGEEDAATSIPKSSFGRPLEVVEEEEPVVATPATSKKEVKVEDKPEPPRVIVPPAPAPFVAAETVELPNSPPPPAELSVQDAQVVEEVEEETPPIIVPPPPAVEEKATTTPDGSSTATVTPPAPAEEKPRVEESKSGEDEVGWYPWAKEPETVPKKKAEPKTSWSPWASSTKTGSTDKAKSENKGWSPFQKRSKPQEKKKTKATTVSEIADKKTPLSPLDARVLQTMLEEDGLDAVTEEKARSILIQNGVAVPTKRKEVPVESAAADVPATASETSSEEKKDWSGVKWSPSSSSSSSKTASSWSGTGFVPSNEPVSFEYAPATQESAPVESASTDLSGTGSTVQTTASKEKKDWSGVKWSPSKASGTSSSWSGTGFVPSNERVSLDYASAPMEQNKPVEKAAGPATSGLNMGITTESSTAKNDWSGVKWSPSKATGGSSWSGTGFVPSNEPVSFDYSSMPMGENKPVEKPAGLAASGFDGATRIASESNAAKKDWSGVKWSPSKASSASSWSGTRFVPSNEPVSFDYASTPMEESKPVEKAAGPAAASGFDSAVRIASESNVSKKDWSGVKWNPSKATSFSSWSGTGFVPSNEPVSFDNAQSPKEESKPVARTTGRAARAAKKDWSGVKWSPSKATGGSFWSGTGFVPSNEPLSFEDAPLTQGSKPVESSRPLRVDSVDSAGQGTINDKKDWSGIKWSPSRSTSGKSWSGTGFLPSTEPVSFDYAPAMQENMPVETTSDPPIIENVGSAVQVTRTEKKDWSGVKWSPSRATDAGSSWSGTGYVPSTEPASFDSASAPMGESKPVEKRSRSQQQRPKGDYSLVEWNPATSAAQTSQGWSGFGWSPGAAGSLRESAPKADVAASMTVGSESVAASVEATPRKDYSGVWKPSKMESSPSSGSSGIGFSPTKTTTAETGASSGSNAAVGSVPVAKETQTPKGSYSPVKWSPASGKEQTGWSGGGFDASPVSEEAPPAGGTKDTSAPPKSNYSPVKWNPSSAADSQAWSGGGFSPAQISSKELVSSTGPSAPVIQSGSDSQSARPQDNYSPVKWSPSSTVATSGWSGGGFVPSSFTTTPSVRNQPNAASSMPASVVTPVRKSDYSPIKWSPANVDQGAGWSGGGFAPKASATVAGAASAPTGTRQVSVQESPKTTVRPQSNFSPVKWSPSSGKVSGWSGSGFAPSSDTTTAVPPAAATRVSIALPSAQSPASVKGSFSPVKWSPANSVESSGWSGGGFVPSSTSASAVSVSPVTQRGTTLENTESSPKPQSNYSPVKWSPSDPSASIKGSDWSGSGFVPAADAEQISPVARNVVAPEVAQAAKIASSTPKRNYSPVKWSPSDVAESGWSGSGFSPASSAGDADSFASELQSKSDHVRSVAATKSQYSYSPLKWSPSKPAAASGWSGGGFVPSSVSSSQPLQSSSPGTASSVQEVRVAQGKSNFSPVKWTPSKGAQSGGWSGSGFAPDASTSSASSAQSLESESAVDLGSSVPAVRRQGNFSPVKWSPTNPSNSVEGSGWCGSGFVPSADSTASLTPSPPSTASLPGSSQDTPKRQGGYSPVKWSPSKPVGGSGWSGNAFVPSSFTTLPSLVEKPIAGSVRSAKAVPEAKTSYSPSKWSPSDTKESTGWSGGGFSPAAELRSTLSYDSKPAVAVSPAKASAQVKNYSPVKWTPSSGVDSAGWSGGGFEPSSSTSEVAPSVSSVAPASRASSIPEKQQQSNYSPVKWSPQSPSASVGGSGWSGSAFVPSVMASTTRGTSSAISAAQTTGTTSQKKLNYSPVKWSPSSTTQATKGWSGGSFTPLRAGNTEGNPTRSVSTPQSKAPVNSYSPVKWSPSNSVAGSGWSGGGFVPSGSLSSNTFDASDSLADAKTTPPQPKKGDYLPTKWSPSQAAADTSSAWSGGGFTPPSSVSTALLGDAESPPAQSSKSYAPTKWSPSKDVEGGAGWSGSGFVPQSPTKEMPAVKSTSYSPTKWSPSSDTKTSSGWSGGGFAAAAAAVASREKQETTAPVKQGNYSPVKWSPSSAVASTGWSGGGFASASSIDSEAAPVSETATSYSPVQWSPSNSVDSTGWSGINAAQATTASSATPVRTSAPQSSVKASGGKKDFSMTKWSPHAPTQGTRWSGSNWSPTARGAAATPAEHNEATVNGVIAAKSTIPAPQAKSNWAPTKWSPSQEDAAPRINKGWSGTTALSPPPATLNGVDENMINGNAPPTTRLPANAAADPTLERWSPYNPSGYVASPFAPR